MAKKQPSPKRGSDIYAGYKQVQDDFSTGPVGGRTVSPKVKTDGSMKKSTSKPVIGSKK